MTHHEFIANRSLGLRSCVTRYGMWVVVVLLAMQSAQASFPRGPQELLPGGQHPRMLFAASLLSMSPALQSGMTAENGPTASGAGMEAIIEAAIGHLQKPDLSMLANALGLSSSQIGHQAFEDSATGMETLTGLGLGSPPVAVKWQSPHSGQQTMPENEPDLYLLSWNGGSWQASYLTTAIDALTLQVLPVAGSAPPLFAVIVFRGVTAVPYPVIFQFQDHHALLLWDGRSESSLYMGYNYGSIEFEKAKSGNVPVMIATGRADPGLLVFSSSSEESGRGFQVATVYAWQNDAYVPVRTEYTENRDYTIYRFIAALHLHDFKAAYSLIDPAKFLKTKKPSLKLFRSRIQKVWPEFTDDKIFEVPAEPLKGSGSHAFILQLGHGKMNVYQPTFTSGPAYRLAGLTRTKSKE